MTDDTELSVSTAGRNPPRKPGEKTSTPAPAPEPTETDGEE